MMFRALHWACRIFLGVIFIYAGYTKIQSPLQFAAAVEAYQLLPSDAVIRVVEFLPWFEVVLGAVLISGIKVRYVAGLAGSFLAFFIVVMTVTYLRGIEADCGCFGVGEKISPLTLVRDTMLILPALFLAVEPWFRARIRLRGETVE